MKSIRYKGKTITPSKVVCVGRNYVEHIRELGNEIPKNLVIFNKPNSAICDELYFFSDDTRFEGEISFLIEKGEIRGVGFGLDLTHAKIQNHLKERGLPWERAKSFDKSAVFSEFVEIEDRDIEFLRFELFINKKLVQYANTNLMIYKPKTILKEINSFISLEDGDIIMSGTPKGVAYYQREDEFLVKVYIKDKLIIEKEWIVL